MTYLRIGLMICFLILGQGYVKGQVAYFPPVSGTTWDTVAIDSLGWCHDKVDSLVDYVGSTNSKAFILLVDGKIAIEHYYGSFTKDSLWYWASAGKTLTATLVGIAQQEGRLSISDTTNRYLGRGFTNCTAAQEDNITIKNQLCMTTGLDDSVADNHCTLDSCLIYKAPAGTRWAYHNAPYTLLDSVLQVATGSTVNAYNQAKIKTPTGITGFYVPSGFDHVYYSTARSMARFGLLMANKGIWNTTPILADSNYYQQMTTTSQSLNKSYGYLWWLNGKPSFMVPTLQTIFPGWLNPNAPIDMIAALGKNGQIINIANSKKIVFIRMGNAPNATGELPVVYNDTIWQKINRLPCIPTDIGIHSNASICTIAPNPADHYLQLQVAPGVYRIDLYNAQGSSVGQYIPTSRIFQIPVAHLNNGLYYVRIWNTVKGESSTYPISILH